MLRTLMFSDSSGTPGLTPQIPRITRSIGTPALDARYRASMIASSTIEFSLIRMPDRLPAFAFSVSMRMRLSSPLRRCSGATSSRLNFFSIA
jgi:hypothetical protein